MDWKRQTWRAVMILSACANIVAVIVGIWLYLAMKGTAKAVRDAEVMCIPPTNPNFDQIASIAAMGRFDMLSGIFTAFAIMLAFAGFVSISIFRREVVGEARDEVQRIVPDEVRRVVQENYPSGPSGNGGQVYTPTDVPYISPEGDAAANADARPAADDSGSPEPTSGSGDSDGARLGP